MTATELKRRAERADHEALIVMRTGDQGDYLVYSPVNPAKQYYVGGDEENPTCTCPDFRKHEADPGWRCKHILAVYRESHEPPGNGSQRIASPAPSEEGHTGGEILVRRSASPDGKIDSVTIEWRWVVEDRPVTEVTNRALQVLAIADEVIGQYMGPRPKTPRATGQAVPMTASRPPTNGRPTNGHGVLPAQLVAVSGMDGRWGRRLFLQLESANGSLRVYGSAKELSAAITQAGYPHLAGNIVEGVALNVPCRVVTKPSPNGRYQDVDRVLPPESAPQTRRWAS